MMTFLRLVLLGLSLVGAIAGGLRAQSLVPQTSVVETGVLELSRHMQIARLMEQLRQEGLVGAEKLAAQFDISHTSGLTVQMERLFDTAAMEALFLSELQKGLADDPVTLQAAIGFFATPLGQRVVGAEISGRQLIQTPEGEVAAKATYASLTGADDQRRHLIDAMIAKGDLVEFNVMGGLNANFAFMRGLADTGVLGEITEQDMLEQVWQDEAAVREDAGVWLTGFMAVAYRDLTLADLQAYSDYMTSPDGKRLNGALFAAFDTLYRGLSGQQGKITGELMQGEDI